jgi:medium-chain acyl-[acyl-carrier-protein] hydrolase
MASRWFQSLTPQRMAPMRLFCFPYAGGGISIFRSWAAALPADVELVGCQLPGREDRIREAPVTALEPLVNELLQEMPAYLDRPFLFFGHSLGGLIAFELARRLHGMGAAGPLRRVITSGCRPPHLRGGIEAISGLPEPAFLESLRTLSGTPEQFFSQPELMDIYLPILRADFAVAESYLHEGGQALPCPLDVYAGIDDEPSLDDMAGWRRYTGGAFRLVGFPGGHFFLNSHRAAVQECLADALRSSCR